MTGEPDEESTSPTIQAVLGLGAATPFSRAATPATAIERQVAPPSPLRRIVPPSPTAQTTVEAVSRGGAASAAPAPTADGMGAEAAPAVGAPMRAMDGA